MRNAIICIISCLGLFACSHLPEIDNPLSLQCGDKLVSIQATYKDSMILEIDGINNLLIKIFSVKGLKYKNNASRVVFSIENKEMLLTVHQHTYPACQKI